MALLRFPIRHFAEIGKGVAGDARIQVGLSLDDAAQRSAHEVFGAASCKIYPVGSSGHGSTGEWCR